MIKRCSPPLSFHRYRYNKPASWPSLLLALGLVVLLSLAPLSFSAIAQRSSLSPDADALFEAKADPLLQSVRRAVRVDNAARKNQQSGLTSTRAARTSEVDGLSKITSARRLQNGTVNVSLTVRLTRNSVAELTNAGFAVGARVGDVATVETDVERLPELAALASVRKMSAATYSYPTNDLARQAIGVDNSSGTRQISQTGRGVIVGVLDTGIDFRHPDFTVPGTDGKQTRIKALLDMTIYSQQSSDWNYVLPEGSASIGHLYTEADINAALQLPASQAQNSDIVKERDKHGHGTFTAGIAAGNGLAGSQSGKYAGMAPEADLVIVKVSRNNTEAVEIFDSDIINGMKFIQQMASEMHKPFVINMSLGTNVGSHDGTMDQERAIDELVNSGPGRAFCLATGNYGHVDVHASGNLTGGSTTLLNVNVNAGSSPQFLGLAYSRSDTLSVTLFRPDGVSIGPLSYTTTPVPVSNQYVDLYNSVDDKRDTDPQNDQKAVAIFFKTPAANLGSGSTRTWTIMLETGGVSDGRFDAWIENGKFTNFVDGSRRLSTTATAREGITVGGFVSRSGNFGAVGNYASYTGVGPTADGREKPDITTPSSFVYSAKSSVGIGLATPQAPDSPFHTGAHGTSASAPVVAGAVALLLQTNPNLTSDQIKNLIRSTATRDSFTGQLLWSERFGMGKLNISEALRALQPTGNSIDDTSVFIIQQYIDFLKRLPDPGADGVFGTADDSLKFYQDLISNYLNTAPCTPTNVECLNSIRGIVAGNFFRSPEFQRKGNFVMYLYMVSIGQRPVTAAELPLKNDPALNDRPSYDEFMADLASISTPNDDPTLTDQKKNALLDAWMLRPQIQNSYGGLSNAQFVQKLIDVSGVTPANQNWVLELDSGNKTRAQVLREFAESPEVNAKFYQQSYVTMEYIGYLLRKPEDCHDPNNWGPTNDPSQCGFIFHNSRFNDSRIDPGHIQNTMVQGFIESPEYRRRFGP